MSYNKRLFVFFFAPHLLGDLLNGPKVAGDLQLEGLLEQLAGLGLGARGELVGLRGCHLQHFVI